MCAGIFRISYCPLPSSCTCLCRGVEWSCSTPEDQGMVREKQYWVGNVFPSTRESEKWLWLLTGSTYTGQGAPAACLPGDS